MFNWPLFLCLVVISVPGLLVSIPGLIKTLEKTVLGKLPPDKKVPPRSILTILSCLQTLLLITLAAAVGTILAPRVGLGAPFFEALVSGKPLWDPLALQILYGLGFGVGGALIIVAAYYLVFRPRLDEQTLRGMEGLRMELGIWARVLYGGIVEEVMFRWGVMTLLAWLGALLFGEATPAVVWAVIVISGILFGIGHLPSYQMAGCQKTPLFLGLMISINLWATLICGWLFWQHGLLAAMVAHMLYHLVWLPFDLYFYRRAEPELAV